MRKCTKILYSSPVSCPVCDSTQSVYGIPSIQFLYVYNFQILSFHYVTASNLPSSLPAWHLHVGHSGAADILCDQYWALQSFLSEYPFHASFFPLWKFLLKSSQLLKPKISFTQPRNVIYLSTLDSTSKQYLEHVHSLHFHDSYLIEAWDFFWASEVPSYVTFLLPIFCIATRTNFLKHESYHIIV